MFALHRLDPNGNSPLQLTRMKRERFSTRFSRRFFVSLTNPEDFLSHKNTERSSPKSQ
jgi:hypothetical protein